MHVIDVTVRFDWTQGLISKPVYQFC
jgi:hypothetical protein